MLDLSAGSWLLRPVQAHSLRHLIAWPIAAAALLTAPGAVADDNDPATIEQRLKALETTPERQTVLREPAANARKAIQRVLDARAAGDAAHAVELFALARDWVQLAANVVRAIELERELITEQTRLAELEQQRRRTETLLEATVAQRERTREELNRLKAQKAQKAPSASKKGVSSATTAPPQTLSNTRIKPPKTPEVGAKAQVKP